MFSIEELNDPLKVSEKICKKDGYRHKYYKDTVKHAKAMGVHVEGDKPIDILERNRPNEPADVRKYRLSVWKNITESLSGKVLHTIAKIFDPKLYRVKYPEPPRVISEEESLETYLNYDFGIYKSIWVFIKETLLTKEMSDPNSICLIMPEYVDVMESEYYKPVPFIFKSEYVVDFIEDEYYILYVPKEEKHNAGNKGDLWIITKESIRKYYKDTKNLSLVFEIETGFLPVFRLGGVVKGDRTPYWYKSFIGGIQPHWDKVVSMVSDLDGSIVNHLFPTPWEWTVECDSCKGKGYINKELENNKGEYAEVKCSTCEGTGKMASKSPFGGYTIKRDALNPELPSPIPPAGFITKDIAPIQELKTLKDEEILKGFEAINMEVVHRTPEAQSGIAKTIDRADLDSMLMRIASHIFECNIEPIIKYVAIWRYGKIVDQAQLMEYIQGVEISQPKDFSVIGINFLMDELKAATGSNVSSNYIRQIESEIVSTRFSNNDKMKNKSLSIIELKPFPGKSDDEIALGVANGTIKKSDAIRNTYIDELVTIAISENEEFLNLSFSERKRIIEDIIQREYIDELAQTIPVE